MEYRKAIAGDVERIWQILQGAIAQRKADGSTQWQDGYPNMATVKTDIKHGYGYVFMQAGVIVGYAAVIFDKEPAYEAIEGNWLTNGAYVVVHRVAVAKDATGKGVATAIMKAVEQIALANAVHSIKVDTNFDNFAMLKILDRLGYTYCGEVYFRGTPRRAYEKVLNSN